MIFKNFGFFEIVFKITCLNIFKSVPLNILRASLFLPVLEFKEQEKNSYIGVASTKFFDYFTNKRNFYVELLICKQNTDLFVRELSIIENRVIFVNSYICLNRSYSRDHKGENLFVNNKI